MSEYKKQYLKVWYKKNKTRLNIGQRVYHVKNQDRRKVQRKVHYKNNPDYFKNYREEHRDKMNAYMKWYRDSEIYIEQRKKYDKEYYQRNKEKRLKQMKDNRNKSKEETK